MNVEVTIPHASYPSDVREQVAERLLGLERFFDRTQSIRAILDVEHDEHRVELVANARRGVVLVVDSKAPTLGQALDESLDRMARVLRKHKEKLVDTRRGGRADEV